MPVGLYVGFHATFTSAVDIPRGSPAGPGLVIGSGPRKPGPAGTTEAAIAGGGWHTPVVMQHKSGAGHRGTVSNREQLPMQHTLHAALGRQAQLPGSPVQGARVGSPATPLASARRDPLSGLGAGDDLLVKTSQEVSLTGKREIRTMRLANRGFRWAESPWAPTFRNALAHPRPRSLRRP